MASRRLVGLVAVIGVLAAPLAACSDSSVMHMRVGQCILLPEGSEETTATTLETTGCTHEHDAEVFHIDTLNRQAESMCISAFDEYVGADYLTSSLDATWMIPTKDSWAHKDRTIVCLARPLDHSKLTQSVRDSGM